MRVHRCSNRHNCVRDDAVQSWLTYGMQCLPHVAAQYAEGCNTTKRGVTSVPLHAQPVVFCLCAGGDTAEFCSVPVACSHILAPHCPRLCQLDQLSESVPRHSKLACRPARGGVHDALFGLLHSLPGPRSSTGSTAVEHPHLHLLPL